MPKAQAAAVPDKQSKTVPAAKRESEFLDTQAAADYINMSRQFLEIARHRGDGSGPEYIKLARAVRYRPAALDRWMDSHTRTGTEPVGKSPAGLRQ